MHIDIDNNIDDPTMSGFKFTSPADGEVYHFTIEGRSIKITNSSGGKVWFVLDELDLAISALQACKAYINKGII